MQSLNVPSPINVTDDGIIIFVNDVQPLNAFDPKLVTVDGTFISVSFEHPKKAFLAILTPLIDNKRFKTS